MFNQITGENSTETDPVSFGDGALRFRRRQIDLSNHSNTREFPQKHQLISRVIYTS